MKLLLPQLLLALLLLLLQATLSLCESNSSSDKQRLIQEMVESLVAPPYNPSLRPGTELRRPDVINVSMRFIDFANFDTRTMDFTTSVYFRRIWRDERMSYNKSLTNILSISFMVDKVWKPDIYFLNEKSGIGHKITVPNILLQVEPDGRTILSNKYSLVMSCKFELKLFPMDSQVCHIDFGSYGYRTSDIILKWSDTAGVVLGEAAQNLPEYDVVKATQHDCTKGYELTGYYTCLRASLHMKRKFNYYLIQVYIPSILVVVLSWVSFWIDHSATPARITLGLLTVLTVTTQSSSIRSDMPRVSYVKAIDVWLTGCLTFVFMALIEFAAVNVVQRRPGTYRTAERWRRPKDLLRAVRSMKEQSSSNEDKQQDGNKDDEDKSADKQEPNSTAAAAPMPELPSAETAEPSSCLFRNKGRIVRWLTCDCFSGDSAPRRELNDAEFVDFLAKYFFPGSFIAFNLVYWTYYKVMEAQSSPTPP